MQNEARPKKGQPGGVAGLLFLESCKRFAFSIILLALLVPLWRVIANKHRKSEA